MGFALKAVGVCRKYGKQEVLKDFDKDGKIATSFETEGDAAKVSEKYLETFK